MSAPPTPSPPVPGSTAVPVTKPGPGAGCAKFVFRFLEIVFFLIVTSPVLLLGLIAWLTWPEYSSVWKSERSFDNALIAIAGVGGVLWSGAVITYSIHQKYTPKLRTAVQLINFSFIAALVGLVAQGASLRTAFYFIAWFYGISAILSFIFRAVESHLDSAFTTQIAAAEKDPANKAAVALKGARDGLIRYIQRIEHGAWYFAFVAVVCIATVVLARQDVIAWSCIVVIIVSVALVVPELFDQNKEAPVGDK